MMLPFWVMVGLSLGTQPASGLSIVQSFFPWPLDLSHYQKLFQQVAMGHYFLNSVWVSTLTTLGQLLLCSLAGYGFSRLSLPYKEIWFFMFLITLMIPAQVNIVPLFFMMKHLGWIDTYQGLIIPGLFSAYGVFLMRQWFDTLPKALEESARLDGCSSWQIYRLIAMPLAKPALICLGTFAFVTSWNSFLWPLLVTNHDALRTLPVGIACLKGSYRDVIDWPMLMAASTLSVLPPVVIFSVVQKQFIAGMLSGALKE
jgi:multiple sugar transport system permease protein